MTDADINAKVTPNQIYLGYRLEDLKLLEKYHHPGSIPAEGFYTDYFGIKTRLSYLLAEETGHDRSVGQLPFPDDSLHAEAIEYIAAAKAVDSSQDSFTAVELGAGYAPWLVFAGTLALRKGLRRITLIAVEADIERHSLISSHFADNQLPPPGEIRSIGSSIVSTHLIHGAVTGGRGRAVFGKTGPLDWGGAATESLRDLDYRGHRVATATVTAYSIAEIIKDLERVDFLHVDIQGSEYKSISRSLDILYRKVMTMTVATHSRKIEGDLLACLLASGWMLVHEKPCKFEPRMNVEVLEGLTTLDGTQVWLNPAHPASPLQQIDRAPLEEKRWYQKLRFWIRPSIASEE